jgi:hypothetical protein
MAAIEGAEKISVQQTILKIPRKRLATKPREKKHGRKFSGQIFK